MGRALTLLPMAFCLAFLLGVGGCQKPTEQPVSQQESEGGLPPTLEGKGILISANRPGNVATIEMQEPDMGTLAFKVLPEFWQTITEGDTVQLSAKKTAPGPHLAYTITGFEKVASGG